MSDNDPRLAERVLAFRQAHSEDAEKPRGMTIEEAEAKYAADLNPRAEPLSWPIEDGFFHPIPGNEEYNAAISEQWDAVRTLLKYHVLSETAQAMKSSPLFWPWRSHFDHDDVRIHAPGLQPRWDGIPVFVLSLSYAMRLAALEEVIAWMAGGWRASGESGSETE